MSFPRSASNYSACDGSQSPGGGGSISGRRMTRQNSFAVSMRDSVLWLGEQAQTAFLDRNLEAHYSASNSQQGGFGGDDGSVRTTGSSAVPNKIRVAMPSYNSLDWGDDATKHTIRAQVIVWSISAPDVKSGIVSMKFRATLFWNDPSHAQSKKEDHLNHDNTETDDNGGVPVAKKRKGSKKQSFMWQMAGRSVAYKKKVSDHPEEDLLDVPTLSILNADSFEIIGAPEVMLLREDTRLYRWSCMYRANLHQSEMSVTQYPHDKHDLCLKLGILSQRQLGGRWDRRKWKLALANESDTQGSIRVPYGLLVDKQIPGFHYDKDGLQFNLVKLEHGSALQAIKDQDFYLQVSLRVERNSGYFDKNIMPLLSTLNLVSISILSLDAGNFFQRALLSLNIAFVEVGIRMSLDDRLPSVGYQIKMQRILNFFFYSILAIVMESSILKFMLENNMVTIGFSRWVDVMMTTILLMNQAYLSLIYVSFSRLREKVADEADSW